MILALIAVGLAGAKPAAPAPAPEPAPVVQPLSEAAHAIEAGRLEQARIMVGNAVKAGVKGPELDRVLADLAYASSDYKSALPAYMSLMATGGGDGRMYERAGVSAAQLGDMNQAGRLLEKATSYPQATWRAWNARGVAADYRRDWTTADLCYARAEALAPKRAEVFNNSGWSLLVRGKWLEALPKIERAAALDPKSERIAHNLELARAAVTEALPERRPGESDKDWAARLNDAGVMARIQGNQRKAVAAFAQAVEARSEYYERAANNLATVQAPR